jgi:hypothetical protein
MIMFTYLVSEVSGQIAQAYGEADQNLISTLGTCYNDFGIAGSVLWAFIVFRKQAQGETLSVLRNAALLSVGFTLISWLYFMVAVVF